MNDVPRSLLQDADKAPGALHRLLGSPNRRW